MHFRRNTCERFLCADYRIVICIYPDKGSPLVELLRNRECVTRTAECRVQYRIVWFYRQLFNCFM